MAKKKDHRRSDGLVEKKITIGKTLEGKPVRKSFYGQSGADVEEKIKEYYKNSQYQEIDESITLSVWADKWLAAYKEGNVKDITFYSTYKQIIERHIKPYFKDARLAAIRPMDIQNFFNEKSNLSSSVLNKIKLNLNAMFKAAIDNDLIIKNPAKNIAYKSTKVKKEKRAYSKKEVDDIITFAKLHRYGAPIIVMLKTGLRRSELLALEWQDISLKDKILTVSKSVSVVNGRVMVGTPKTKTSKSDVPFDDELKSVFLSIPRNIKSNIVFPNTKGKPFNPGNWSRRNYKTFMNDYRSYCSENDLPAPRILEPHELRHTFGSLLYDTTRDIHIVSRLMRHASIDITSKIYVHEDIDAKRNAIQKLSEYLKN